MSTCLVVFCKQRIRWQYLGVVPRLIGLEKEGSLGVRWKGMAWVLTSSNSRSSSFCLLFSLVYFFFSFFLCPRLLTFSPGSKDILAWTLVSLKHSPMLFFFILDIIWNFSNLYFKILPCIQTMWVTSLFSICWTRAEISFHRRWFLVLPIATNQVRFLVIFKKNHNISQIGP